MSDAFTRRGFVRAAGFGLAAIWAPALARAGDDLVLTPRWEVAASALRVTLHLRGPERRAVEVPGNYVRLFAHFSLGPEGRPELELESEAVAFQRRSRAGFRLGRRLVIPAGEEVAYDTFTGEWPAYAQGDVSMALRTELRAAPGSRPEGDQAALAALAGLRGHATHRRR